MRSNHHLSGEKRASSTKEAPLNKIYYMLNKTCIETQKVFVCDADVESLS